MNDRFVEIVKKDYNEMLYSLDEGSVDLILTDPPYTISKETGFKSVKDGVKRFSVSMDFGKWDHEVIDLVGFAEGAYRSLRKGGTIIVWYDLWKISHLATAMDRAGFKMRRLIVWNKTNPVPINSKISYLTNAREIAVCAVKVGKPTFNSSYDSGRYDDVAIREWEYDQPIPRHKGKRIHPTQKPLDLFEKIIEKHSRPGDVVVDPFLGSGTTAVAARNTGRAFIGGDIDPTYVTKAKRRLRDGRY